MGALARQIHERTPIGEVVRKEFRAALDDKAVARKRLLERAAVFWEDYRDEACEALIARELERIIHEDRQSAVGSASMPPIPQNGYEGIKRSAAKLDHWLLFRLGNGRKLADAQPAEVAVQAAMLIKHGETAVWHGRVLVLVERACTDKKKTVGEQLNEAQIDAMVRKVR